MRCDAWRVCRLQPVQQFQPSNEVPARSHTVECKPCHRGYHGQLCVCLCNCPLLLRHLAPGIASVWLFETFFNLAQPQPASKFVTIRQCCTGIYRRHSTPASLSRGSRLLCMAGNKVCWFRKVQQPIFCFCGSLATAKQIVVFMGCQVPPWWHCHIDPPSATAAGPTTARQSSPVGSVSQRTTCLPHFHHRPVLSTELHLQVSCP